VSKQNLRPARNAQCSLFVRQLQALRDAVLCFACSEALRLLTAFVIAGWLVSPDRPGSSVASARTSASLPASSLNDFELIPTAGRATSM
jgi:hypothetical protein